MEANINIQQGFSFYFLKNQTQKKALPLREIMLIYGPREPSFPTCLKCVVRTCFTCLRALSACASSYLCLLHIFIFYAFIFFTCLYFLLVLRALIFLRALRGFIFYILNMPCFFMCPCFFKYAHFFTCLTCLCFFFAFFLFLSF